MKSRNRFRTVVQTFSLLLFVLLLCLSVYPVSPGVPYDLFLRMDPLVALGSLLGAWDAAPRLLFCLFLVGMTLLAGRIFCAWLCPLGSAIDLSDAAAYRKRKILAKQNSRHRNLRHLKYCLLVLLLVSGALGFSLLFALDPISLATRTFALMIYPLLSLLANALLDLSRPLQEAVGLTGLAHTQLAQPVHGSNLITFLIFAGVLSLAFFSRRFWCRTLCPLGALLALLSLFSPIRRRVGADCPRCGRCQAACPMDAIPEDPRETVHTECIGCQTCAEVCPESVVSFGFVPRTNAGRRSEVDLSRRGFVYSLAGGVSLGLVHQTQPAHSRLGTDLLRPPGALPERWFNDTCIRCGACMKACVTNTLQPCSLETGLASLWTPRHRMRLAGCEQACNVCGQVCPTQAIRALPLIEKQHARIGTAVLLRKKCLAWEQHRLCLICDEACPYNAIVFKVVEGRKRPFVDESRCSGCGICEQVCPIGGAAAIHVEPMGQLRLKTGSYVEEARRLSLNFSAPREADRLDPAGPEQDHEDLDDPKGETKTHGLPPGFLP